MTRPRNVPLALGALALTTALTTSAAAQEPDPTMKSCVSLFRVDHTDVIDNQTILFYMKGGEIYRNSLPYDCPGLDYEDTFMYRVSLNQLCNVDVITVLQNAGFGLLPGASCGLGKFQSVNRETVDQLLSGKPEPAVEVEVDKSGGSERDGPN